MIMAIKFMKKFILLNIIIYLTSSPLWANGEWVICQGSDGHLSIEVSQNGLCTDIQGKNLHDEHDSIPDDDHCGTCKDIPIQCDKKDSPQQNGSSSSSSSLSIASLSSSLSSSCPFKFFFFITNDPPGVKAAFNPTVPCWTDCFKTRWC